MAKINPAPPTDWRDLQTQVHRILVESGLTATIEKKVELARGETSVDVYAEDPAHTPPSVIMCECKQWGARVPQANVRAFRQEVQDHGANLGLLISKAGFQSGAKASAQHSNVKLVTWHEFEEIFAKRWFERYFIGRLGADDVDPFLTYTEPLSPSIFLPRLQHDERAVKEFQRLLQTYTGVGFLITYFVYGRELGTNSVFDSANGPRVPLKDVRPAVESDDLPKDVLEADSVRGLLDALVSTAVKGIGEFRAVCKGPSE